MFSIFPNSFIIFIMFCHLGWIDASQTLHHATHVLHLSKLLHHLHHVLRSSHLLQHAGIHGALHLLHDLPRISLELCEVTSLAKEATLPHLPDHLLHPLVLVQELCNLRMRGVGALGHAPPSWL